MKTLTINPLNAELIAQGHRKTLAFKVQGRLAPGTLVAIATFGPNTKMKNAEEQKFVEQAHDILNVISWPNTMKLETFQSRRGKIVAVARVSSVKLGYCLEHGFTESKGEADLIEFDQVYPLPNPVTFSGDSFIQSLDKKYSDVKKQITDQLLP
jgi:hypothetical protein